MRLTRYADVGDFYRRAEPFLLEHEAEHGLMIGICNSLLLRNAPTDPAHYFAAVEDDDGTVVAAALRTPPFNITLSRVAPDAPLDEVVGLLATDAHEADRDLPGVVARSEVSRAFAVAWQRVAAQPYTLRLNERIYRLDRVEPVTGVPGELHRATSADHATLVRWIEAFDREALGGEIRDADGWVDDALADERVRGLFLWVDGGQPVALAGYQGPTPHGMRIGPVYTPPERRGHGYASACTAGVTQWLLDNGRQFCTLYTNLANPTANHIYQVIGYKPVADVELYGFSEP